MRTLIFRHAERENSGSSNPPLSLRGLKQSESLLNLVSSQRLPLPTRLLVSPRLRSQQTFRPLEKHLNVESQIHALLDERQSSENTEQFRKRIKKFIQSCESHGGVVFICTHLDWLEEACHLIPSETDLVQEKYLAWMPAQYMDFDVRDGQWTLHQFGSVDL